MKKINYLISTPGRFHNFEVAKILYNRNQLHKIVSGFPWIKLKREKIPKNFVECFGLDEDELKNKLMIRFLFKLEKWVYDHSNTISAITKGQLDNINSKGIENSKLFYCLITH